MSVPESFTDSDGMKHLERTLWLRFLFVLAVGIVMKWMDLI